MTIVDGEPDPSLHAPSEHGLWVVGLDGSKHAANALAWATMNAPGRAESLQLVTAWQIPVVGAYPMASPAVVPFDDRELEAAAAGEIAELAERAEKELSIPVDVAVAQGGPASVLLEASTRGSLLVVGSRGRGGFARLMLGSTSTQCATHATVPTVVVRSAPEAPTKRILVGFDGSANSMASLRWAIHFAAPGTTVVVTWVWDTTPLAVGADAFFFPDASDLATERFDHLVESVTDEAIAGDVILEQDFLRGTPRSALSAAAEDADLLVVGARGHGAVGSAVLGSVSTWLLHHCKIPIVVVPFAAPSEKEPNELSNG